VIIKINEVIAAIKGIATTFYSFWLWLKRKKATKILEEDADTALEIIDKEVRGVNRATNVEPVLSPEEIPNKVRIKDKNYEIAVRHKKRFTRHYASTWADLEREVLIKSIEGSVYPQIKELLPLDAAYGFDLFLAYLAAIQMKKFQVARGIREDLEIIITRPGLSGAKNWYEIFETLHNGGRLKSIVLPVLDDTYEICKPNIDNMLRNECAKFVKWAKKWTTSPPRIEIPPFIQNRIKVNLIPIHDRPWKDYAGIAIDTIQKCNHVFFCSSDQHEFKAIEAALGSKILAPKFKLGITRILINKEFRFRGLVITVQIVRGAEKIEEYERNKLIAQRTAFASDNKIVKIRKGDQIDATRKIEDMLRKFDEIWIENDETGWGTLPYVVYPVINKTEAKITGWGFEPRGATYIAMIKLSAEKSRSTLS